MISKQINVETILRDQEVADLYVRDAMTRESALLELQAVWKAWQVLLKTPLENCAIPNDWLMDPVRSVNERIILKPDGAHKEDENGSHAVFPGDPLQGLQNLVMLGNTIDRCSVGCCYSHFMAYMGFAWMTTWGYCHDTWNSIRNAAKH